MRTEFKTNSEARLETAASSRARARSGAEIAAEIALDLRRLKRNFVASAASDPATASYLALAGDIIATAAIGSVPLFAFDFIPHSAHSEFGLDLLDADILELPFESVILSFPSRLDTRDVQIENYAIVHQKRICDIVAEISKRSDNKDAAEVERKFRKVYDAQGSHVIVYVGARQATAGGIYIDGLGVVATGQGAKKGQSIRFAVPDFGLICGAEYKIAASQHGVDAVEAMRKDTAFGLHSVIGYLASLLCRDTEIAQGADVARLNASRVKKGKRPLERQFHVRIRGMTRRSAGSGNESGRASPETHFRRGHVRRLTTRTESGDEVRFIRIPPVIVNAEAGTPTTKDYVVDAP